MNYYEFLKSSTTPCRKKSPAPVNGLIFLRIFFSTCLSNFFKRLLGMTSTKLIENEITYKLDDYIRLCLKLKIKVIR